MAKRMVLKEPKDIRRVIQKVISKVFEEGAELEYASRLAPLMNCWMKSWEMEKIKEIEARLTALEKADETKR